MKCTLGKCGSKEELILNQMGDIIVKNMTGR
jgi:hypothetical protein